ncbi:hypothetical protein VDG1235_4827 [Verrucomicrobiia bacterium DG1235]|nr:hypothetical protein VDG1235_4827 [Verrucomicrobiae bacterium DG1235]
MLFRNKIILFLTFASKVCPLLTANPSVVFDHSLHQAAFAAEEIEKALQSREDSDTNGEIILQLIEGDLAPEAFQITTDGSTISISASDPAGLMYGGLEVAELIRIGGLDAIADDTQTPYMQMRGVKFNIPLDVRTPSYSDMSDSAQLNLPHMWDFSFWQEYIDTLARYRYNYVSLWNLHPFPSLVKVPDYPDVALDDVQRSTLSRGSFPTGNHAEFDELYPTTGHEMDQPKILANTETLLELSIDQKIDFWRRVMAYGKSRNVDFYIITWNIFTYGTDGKYGIDDSIENPTTIDYFRKSVRELFLTYPDLRGIGVTTGENMHGASSDAKEDWIFKTYGQGVLDVAKEQPDRKIRFIHRQHQASAEAIAATFKSLLENPNIDFIFSYKYAQAHVYSSTNQNFHQGFLKQIGDVKTIWTLRNDDVYHFRWGAPDFVREFIKNIPKESSQGLYLGSDQYVWGREFLERNPTLKPDGIRQLELSKHWYHWALWGRLSYNPELSNQRFKGILATKFPTANATQLFDAWQSASMIYPLVTGFHWGRLDFQWYIEGGKSRPGPAQTPNGFHDLNRFINLPPHPDTNYTSIPDFNSNPAPHDPDQLSPLQVADSIDKHADQALLAFETFAVTDDTELFKTLEDIRIISYLGKYYAAKIRAATHLDQFRRSGDLDSLHTAQFAAKRSAEFWRHYTSTALTHYHNPIWLNRVGYVDWRETTDDVLHELTNLGSDSELAPMTPTPGGSILEAEDAEHFSCAVDTRYPGFTGSGYARPYSESRPYIEWTYQAKTAGTYTLEFRYATTWWSGFTKLPVSINGVQSDTFQYYRTGSPISWSCDRIHVKLQKGENTIRLQGNRSIIVDHLNILPTSQIANEL